MQAFVGFPISVLSSALIKGHLKKTCCIDHLTRATLVRETVGGESSSAARSAQQLKPSNKWQTFACHYYSEITHEYSDIGVAARLFSTTAI
jgi:hypothetical protein